MKTTKTRPTRKESFIRKHGEVNGPQLRLSMWQAIRSARKPDRATRYPADKARHETLKANQPHDPTAKG